MKEEQYMLIKLLLESNKDIKKNWQTMDQEIICILETIGYLCNISFGLCVMNKVKYFFKISMDWAFRKTQRFFPLGACKLI